MKKAICSMLCVLLALSLSSCGMEPLLPEPSESASSFTDQISLYEDAVTELSEVSYDCLISKTEFFRPDGAGDYVGIFVQNMEDKSIFPYDGHAIKALLSGGVKLIDKINRDDMTLISFSLCIPGRSYDYGYYYCSEGKPVYLGDPAQELTPDKTGFSYTKNTSFGTGVTYYTEQLSDFFFYYEIT